jgi:hypothetical protein
MARSRSIWFITQIQGKVMVRKTIRSCALQLAGGLALCAFAISAQAEPFSLQAACQLTSIVAGQGKCQIQFLLSDSYTTPSLVPIKTGYATVDAKVVYRYMNDASNPVPGLTGTFIGYTGVACGASHTVAAYITKTGVGVVSKKVGNVPAVACPAAP